MKIKPEDTIISVSDIARGLRRLADEIERDENTFQLAWCMFPKHGEVTVGLLGKSASPCTDAYMLFGQGQRFLENYQLENSE